MAAMILGDVIRTRVCCYRSAQLAENILHYVVSAQTGTGAEQSLWPVQLDLALHLAMKAILQNTAEYIGVGAQKIWPLPLERESTTNVNRGYGVQPGSQLPTQVCGLITKLASTAGRGTVGRMYAPFPSDNEIDASGAATTPYVLRLGLVASVLFAPYIVGTAPNQSTLSPCLYRRVTHTVLNFTGYRVARQFATQRSRGAFGKTNPIPF